MNSIFLLQAEMDENLKLPMLSADTAEVYERICEHNWMYPDDPRAYLVSSLENLPAIPRQTLAQCVPVGSIEFVEKVLRDIHGISQITPQLIPEPLRQWSWVRRKTAVVGSVNMALKCFRDFNTDELFIKSASHAKRDFTDIYRLGDSLPETEDSLFVSEVLPAINSEWRVFVFRQRVIDVRNYSGSPWILPSQRIIRDMTEKMGDSLSAYTLDVAVLNGGATVVVEVHNFISCGLYGASVPLSMYPAAFAQESKGMTRLRG